MKTKFIMNNHKYEYKLIYYTSKEMKTKFFNEKDKLIIDFMAVYCYSQNNDVKEPIVEDKFGKRFTFSEFIETNI